MKISPVGGSITFKNGVVGRDLSHEAFLLSPLGNSAKAGLINGEKRQYDISPESGVSGTLFFDGSHLDRVFLMFSLPSDGAGEWTEGHEIERRALHDSWLLSELGEPPYDYAWGSVTSDFDARGCSSEIIISYAR